MLEFSKAKTTEEKLLMVYGFVGTMPIVQLFGFSAFTWLTLLMIGYLLLRKQVKSKFNKKAIPYIVYTALTLLSSFICLVSGMERMWKTIQIPNMIWQLCYLVLFLVYYNKKGSTKCLFYIKGVYYAAFAHAIWGILQFIIYEIAHISINKLIFFDLMHVQMAEYVQMRGSSVAMTGFCWNAGNFAPLLIIGYVLSPSLFSKIFFVGISLISGSRTGITGIIACVFLELFIWMFSKYKKRIKPVHIIGIGILVVAVSIVVVSNTKLMQTLALRIQEMQNTFSFDYLNTQSSSRLHARYWISIPRITQWNGLINNLFGYGNGSSGYPFAQLYNQYADHAWTVECDYINNLWSFGYIGFIVWYCWYGYHIYKGRKLDKKFLVLFLGLLVEGISYNVTFNWCLMFLLFVFIEISYSNNFMSENYLRRKIGQNAIIRNN